MKQAIKKIIASLCVPSLFILSAPLSAVHLDPIFPRFYEINPTFEQKFSYSSTPGVHWSSFQTLGAEVSVCWPVSYTCPCKIYDVQTEVQVAETAVQHMRVDHFNITALRQWDEQFIFGATLQQSFRKALKDPTSFHHGLLEGLFHMAYGKDISIQQCGDIRAYISGTLGIADVSYPWIESTAHWKFDWKYSSLDSFIKVIIGFGNKKFHPHHFQGYGPVKHRSLDIGTRYVYHLDDGRSWILEASSRILSINTVKLPFSFSLTYLFPFGI